MTILRKYLDIISEATANPWEGKDPAKALAWSRLSPQVQQKLGMADPTDEIIVGRMVRGGFLSGEPVTDANPDGTPKQGATPAPTPGAINQAPGGVTRGLQPAPDQSDAAGAAVPPADSPGTVGTAPGVNPVVGQAASGQGDAAGAAVPPADKPSQSGQPAEPKNRDSMTFGQAFADARKNGEKTFTWKGKSYGTELAKPKTAPQPQKTAPQPQKTAPSGQGAMPAPATAQPVDAAALRAQRDAYGTAYVAMKNNPNTPPEALSQMEKNMTDVAAKMKAAGISESETTGYSEDQTLGSIIQLAGLR